MPNRCSMSMRLYPTRKPLQCDGLFTTPIFCVGNHDLPLVPPRPAATCSVRVNHVPHIKGIVCPCRARRKSGHWASHQLSRRGRKPSPKRGIHCHARLAGACIGSGPGEGPEPLRSRARSLGVPRDRGALVAGGRQRMEAFPHLRGAAIGGSGSGSGKCWRGEQHGADRACRLGSDGRGGDGGWRCIASCWRC